MVSLVRIRVNGAMQQCISPEHIENRQLDFEFDKLLTFFLLLTLGMQSSSVEVVSKRKKIRGKNAHEKIPFT